MSSHIHAVRSIKCGDGGFTSERFEDSNAAVSADSAIHGARLYAWRTQWRRDRAFGRGGDEPLHILECGQDRPQDASCPRGRRQRSEEHTSELKSLMRHSYAVLLLK